MTAALTITRTPATRTARTTRSLLGLGAAAGPVYVAVSLAQALTRDGFDLARHPWSALANGDLGWIQVANLLVAGLATLAAAVGLHRALPGSPWAGRLVAGYGIGLVAAGVFKADPVPGFPAGTTEATVSLPGMLHMMSGAVGFSCIIAACFVVARRFAAEGRSGRARCSRAAGAVFGASFVVMAAGGGASWTILAFVAGVLVIWTWLSALSLHLYRNA
ncbi:DUF998 domain-containing protein [Thermomonospora cellulosilytica]|uniref:DUF998 domain-containing protein n=1 Tax=Thermomonospora cellulosilytica TaxID=1411118 RepID=A0A7W3MYA5_9ACTN|nr:DUF998 domain-containing protein [Thermomonospora cellulosilytica]MBA9004134.1 hypothetical protein [Thermomonospora cellulosilytica]